MIFFKKVVRWLRFHFFIKNKYKHRFGKPTLCNIIQHEYHESLFEQETCLVLERYFPNNDILIPSQHNYPTKFDFIINDIAIFEPHGVWNGSDYYTYYKKRKELSRKHSLDLPVVIIPSFEDLKLLDSLLGKESSVLKSIHGFQLQMLQKYNGVQIPSNFFFI